MIRERDFRRPNTLTEHGVIREARAQLLDAGFIERSAPWGRAPRERLSTCAGLEFGGEHEYLLASLHEGAHA